MECGQLCYSNAGNFPLLEMIDQEKKGRVLDCGCGSGDNARILKSRGWTVTGITISRMEQESARAYCDKCYLWDLNNGIPEVVETGYNIILMSHILEHLVYPERLLADIKKVLAADGLVAVALPNVLVYPNRVRFLIGLFEYTPGGVMDRTHVRFYTFRSAMRLLEENKLNVIIARGDGAFPLWKIRPFLPAAFRRRLNVLACNYFPGIFATQMLFLANLHQ